MEHQRREFDSPEAKLTTDAAGLIAEAAKRSELLKRKIDPIDCIKREDDGVAALTSEIHKQQEEALDKMPPRERWFLDLKSRFDALPELHEGIQWTDVERSLRADPETTAKLMVFDEKGHKMNVFGEEGDEFIFVSAWNKHQQVASDHKNIAYDTEGQKLAEQQGYKPNGNAVSIIAKIMDASEDEANNYLADPKFHEQLRRAIAVNGWAWLKTDAATRRTGVALYGNRNGINGGGAIPRDGDGSFRAALRVKKA